MEIPSNREVLIDLGLHARAGLNTRGAALGVTQNTAARVTTDIENLVGVPGSLTHTGAQGPYNKQHAALTPARAARNAALVAGRKLCAHAIDVLKAHLGRRWNPRWTAAGFGGRTLTVTNATVAARLLDLRNFFRSNPAREVASEGITAAAFDPKIAALEAAEHGRDAALRNFRDARDARDAATAQLKQRLSALQEELGWLLEPDDNRWADVGFPRPVDGSRPERVEGLTLTAGLPGTVLAQWGRAARAINFRVSWKPQGSTGDPTVVGLFGDAATTLSGLTSGITIDVFVTARNNAGETVPATATIVVP